ncbi:hypothetical protein Tsubulata_039145 [Turnera subulata]|uniref:Uncharacterized protein n=1 Tax=Turnera subulata TaxID=218843 RepID=A0A9Q0FT87_9ROSI|nr:hypothetical protein Tsubulata_039145 [Turnera subulata]
MSPTGKYYIVHYGYTNMPYFLTPYHGEHYHLCDYRGGRNSQGPTEKFDHNHSSLHNVIERYFRVL